MAELEQTLTDFTSTLASLELLDGHVYRLPAVLEGQEESVINEIKVEHLTDIAAKEAAFSTFHDHFIRAGCSSKATLRLPGWLRFSQDCAPLLEQKVAHINALKEQFKALVQQAGSRDAKFELVHSALPGLITLQVYRKFTVLCGELQSLGFTWADKQTIHRLSKDEVLAMLDKSRHYVPAMMQPAQWAVYIDEEEQLIRALAANAELRIRRPVKTHPMINLRWQIKTPRKQQIKASLPIIVCSDKRPNLGHLADYPPKGRKARSDRKIAVTPLIERLHLYLYQAP